MRTNTTSALFVHPNWGSSYGKLEEKKIVLPSLSYLAPSSATSGNLVTCEISKSIRFLKSERRQLGPNWSSPRPKAHRGKFLIMWLISPRLRKAHQSPPPFQDVSILGVSALALCKIFKLRLPVQAFHQNQRTQPFSFWKYIKTLFEITRFHSSKLVQDQVSWFVELSICPIYQSWKSQSTKISPRACVINFWKYTTWALWSSPSFLIC